MRAFCCSISFFLLFITTADSVFSQSKEEPAPVPASIAIPRPTPEEVRLAERSLAAFLENAAPEVKELNRKYPGLIAVRVPPPNSAVIPNLAPYFQKKHETNLEVARKGDIDVLFMGDSITDFWRNTEGAFAGKPVLDKYFGNLKVANFGIAGDTTEGVLYRLRNGEGRGFSPKAVMLMIGTNNTARNSAAEIAEGVGAVVLELQKCFPKAKILLLGIFHAVLRMTRSVPRSPKSIQSFRNCTMATAFTTSISEQSSWTRREYSARNHDRRSASFDEGIRDLG